MSRKRGKHASGKILISPFGGNRSPRFRLSLEEKRNSMEEGGALMVKGVSKRVIVVKNPDQRYFEQAIFILRSDLRSEEGVSEKEVLRQARRAANEYLRKGGKRTEAPIRRLRGFLCALAGAALTAGTWFAMQIL